MDWRKVVDENPHLHSGKLAGLLGVSQNTIVSYRHRKGGVSWSYTGVGVPFMCLDRSAGLYRVTYKRAPVFHGWLLTAIQVVDWLIYCIEAGYFNLPRVRRPLLI